MSYAKGSDTCNYLNLFLELTGRESSTKNSSSTLNCGTDFSQKQIEVFELLLQNLKTQKKELRSSKATRSLINRIFLTLGLKPVSQNFLDNIFGDTDFSNFDEVNKKIEKFRVACMLEYGNFRYCYKMLRSGKDSLRNTKLIEVLERHFPPRTKIEQNEKDFKTKSPIYGLNAIPAMNAFHLGYISANFAEEISKARKDLKTFLEQAKRERITEVNDFQILEEFAEKKGVEIDRLVRKSSLTSGEALLAPKIYAPEEKYPKIIDTAISECDTWTKEQIEDAKKKAIRNTDIYISASEMDVYMATSMRKPVNFTSNSKFVSDLFSHELLKGMTLNYFDPTQSYLDDRIQKGLIESLMIKRARVTIYNAQESDSFGKDSEASVALSQDKDVIVYVARFFQDLDDFELLYKDIDSLPTDENNIWKVLIEKKLATEDDRKRISVPGTTTSDIIYEIVNKNVNKLIQSLDRYRINAELEHHGYDIPNYNELKADTAKLISTLEKRAFTFKEVHPLSFQISAKSGVARGVYVTRSVAQTAQILKGLLMGNLEYELTNNDSNYILKEKITNCSVRVVVKEPILTNAFWNEFSRNLETKEEPE